jgi:hypothetical protein
MPIPQHARVPHRNSCLRHLCAIAAVVSCISFSGSIAQSQTANKALETLTHVDQIRRLTPEQAALGYPVRIRGVITMDAPAPDFFVQDATPGGTGRRNRAWEIRSRHSRNKLARIGDWTAAEGTSGALFADRKRTTGQPVGAGARNRQVSGG